MKVLSAEYVEAPEVLTIADAVLVEFTFRDVQSFISFNNFTNDLIFNFIVLILNYFNYFFGVESFLKYSLF